MVVHQATISVAVMEVPSFESHQQAAAQPAKELQNRGRFRFQGFRRQADPGVPSAAWLYDLLKPHVANVLVCDPRKNALLKDGSKSDRIVRRQRITSASILSVSGRKLVPSSWVVVGSVLETLGSRGVSDWWLDLCASAPSHCSARYAPSESQK
jgi:hypothetical protein